MVRDSVATILLVGSLLTAIHGDGWAQPARRVHPQDIVFRFRGSVWAMNPEGTNRRRLTNTTACYFPYWLPGGKQIVFLSPNDGEKHWFVVNGDGTGETQRYAAGAEKFAAVRKVVEDNSLHLGMPDLSPDGKRIVFRNVRKIGEECPGDEDILDLFAIDVDGTNLRQLTNDSAAEYQARWSPDGTRIVFDSVPDDGKWNIYLMNADGSGRRRLTDDKANYSRPVWAPDGTRIAFNSDLHQTGRRAGGIFVMDLDGGNLRQLTGLPGDDIVSAAHADWCVRPYAFADRPDYMWPPFQQGPGDPVSKVDRNAEEVLKGKGAEIVRDEHGAVFYVRLRDRNRAGVLTRPFNDSDIPNVMKLHWRRARRDCRPFAAPTLILGNNPISNKGLKRLLENVTSLRSLGLGSSINNAGLEHVKVSADLEMLSIANAQITDAGLATWRV